VSGIAEKQWSGAKRGAGGRGVGTERRAGVTENVGAWCGFIAAHAPLTCSGGVSS